MIIEKVKKLEPIQRIAYWITERQKIRHRRNAGIPKPWTDDVILQTYRFCNVRRMDDAVSDWLYKSWYFPYMNHRNMLYAIALARFINKPDSLGLITSSVFDVKKEPRWENIKKLLRKRRDAGYVVFNAAYMVRGNNGIDKIESVVDKNTRNLKDVLPEFLESTDSMEQAHKILLKSFGMGSFMAGQVVADARWAIIGNWTDRMDWAPAGPGSQRGLNRLLGRPLNQAWKPAEFTHALRLLIDGLVNNERIPTVISNRLEAHDYQNCLCEYDKYERTLFDNRRPKMLFRSEK